MGKVTSYQWVKRSSDWGLPDRVLLGHKGLAHGHPRQIRKEMCLKCDELIEDHGCIGDSFFVGDHYQGALVCPGDWIFVEDGTPEFTVISNPHRAKYHEAQALEVRTFLLGVGKRRAYIQEYNDGSKAFYDNRGELTRIDSARTYIDEVVL